MRATEHADVVARVDGLEAAVLHGRGGVDLAIELLDAAEAAAGVPLVDEAERARLTALARGDDSRPDHWHSILARAGDRAVGYGGLLLPSHPGDLAVGDVAVRPGHARDALSLEVLLASLEALGRRHEAGRVRVWLRHATDADIVRATDVGWSVDRRLGVLGRRLDRAEEPDTPPAVAIRPYAPELADAVVRVLRGAYAGTPDGDWTRAELERRRGYPWYRDEDLLVASRGGQVVGVHWTKRRGAGVGEVYNLAVDPAQQGSGLGAVLLAAGLDHLRRVGCHEVLLWVDLSNERAVRLYTSHGFHVRWEDVAFGRWIVPVDGRDQSSLEARSRSDSGTSL